MTSGQWGEGLVTKDQRITMGGLWATSGARTVVGVRGKLRRLERCVRYGKWPGDGGREQPYGEGRAVVIWVKVYENFPVPRSSTHRITTGRTL